MRYVEAYPNLVEILGRDFRLPDLQPVLKYFDTFSPFGISEAEVNYCHQKLNI